MELIPRLRYAGHYKHSETVPSNFIFPERKLGYYELEIYLNADNSILELNDKIYHVPTKGIIFRKPGDINRSHMPYEGLILIFSFDPVSNIDPLHFDFDIKHSLQNEYIHPLIDYIQSVTISQNPDEYVRLFRRIYQELLINNPLSETVYTSILLEILYQLNMENSKQIFRTDHSIQKAPHPLVPKAVNYINTHLSGVITLDSLCKYLYISKRYLHILFKKYLNISPNDFIIKQKMQMATNMLKTSNLSIEEISVACGFNSVSYFSSSFKKHMGISPSGYRKKM